MEEKYTYSDAFDELQRIVQDIEIGEVTVDELAEKIKRASQLIAVCKAKLTASEEEVDRLLAQLTQAQEDEGSEGVIAQEEAVDDDDENPDDESAAEATQE